MSHSSEQTRARILDVALSELRRHGYTGASLRRIAVSAHVTTGAIYNHFGSKEGMLDALVGEAADELVAAWTAGRTQAHCPRQDGGPGTQADPVTCRAVRSPQEPAEPAATASAVGTAAAGQATLTHSSDRTDDVLALVYERVEVFELLLCRAGGTRYEHVLERLAQIEEESYSRLPGLTDSAADRLFVRTLASNGVEALRTVLDNGLTRQEAQHYMDRLKRFRLGGWAGLLAQDPGGPDSPSSPAGPDSPGARGAQAHHPAGGHS